MRIVGDCSKGVQWLCWWSVAPDPMQNGFGPYGNSQTIWLRLHHVDTPQELEVGDIVTSGPWGSDHAAMVLEAGTDPLMWSFGHQGAPNTYRLSHDWRPKQFCKLPVKPPPPTEDDKLKAMTGWFAWVKWRLGEGEFKHKAPRDKTVRPNVPRRVPVQWWLRFQQFMFNRKRALT